MGQCNLSCAAAPGSAVLPQGKGKLHQAIVVCSLHDGGTWGPNYANVAGSIVAGGISNLYYPAPDRGTGLTFQRAFTVTAQGALGAIGVEFWPDVSRRLFHGPGAGTAPTASSPNSSGY